MEEKWISVDEQLPFAKYGGYEHVLVTCRQRNRASSPDECRWVMILYFDGKNWCYLTGEPFEEEVIAWMPTPAPYNNL